MSANAYIRNFIENECTKVEKGEIDCICPICYEEDDELEENEEQHTYILLPCKHLYHVHCISEWFKIQNNCPHCRKKYNFKTRGLTDSDQLRIYAVNYNVLRIFSGMGGLPYSQ